MDLLDLIVIAVAVIAALGGYRLGLLGRLVSWIGLGLGFYVAVRVLPSVINDLRSSTPGVQLTVAILLLVGGAMIGQAIGLLIGARLQRALPLGPVRQTDRLLGAGLGIVVVVAVWWLLLPSVGSFPGWAARETAGSSISRWVSRTLPTPPPAVQVVRRLLSQDAPQVFAVLNSDVPAGPAPSTSPLSPSVTAAVEASTVKVEGEACNLLYEGSGFAVAPGLVVTNAHVVAGEPAGHTSVLLPSGRQLAATVVMFDPKIDIALLQVGSLGETPLSLLVAHAGATGAVFGHPNGQNQIDIVPARVAVEEEATGLDLYDTATTRRDVLVLAAHLAHGDSGGPLVDSVGRVIGVPFAISSTQSGTSYALSTTELELALGESRSASGVSTGPCLSG